MNDAYDTSQYEFGLPPPVSIVRVTQAMSICSPFSLMLVPANHWAAVQRCSVSEMVDWLMSLV